MRSALAPPLRSLLFARRRARGTAAAHPLARNPAAAGAVVAMTSVPYQYPDGYPIGTPGVPWTTTERERWRARVDAPKRSYADDVLAKLDALKTSSHGDRFEVVKYGALPYDASEPDRYALFACVSREWSKDKPSVLVTGGVHGYETSGVQGAIAFLETAAGNYLDVFNVLVAPCVSPWGYERIQRWNAFAVDPNRSFDRAVAYDPPSPESAALLALVDSMELGENREWMAHFDLHETTDSDEAEFRPAKAARDGETNAPDVIPDGFYCVGDAENSRFDFQAAVIRSVAKVTHIAPPDASGNIIGEPITQEGVIEYPLKALGLCASITGAKYTTTTEVYPDSPTASDEECNSAQVAAVTGGLDYIIAKEGLMGAMGR
jgi:hypothetical protein